MNVTAAEAEKTMIEGLMEEFYQLSLPDKMIASLCMESTACVKHWRDEKEYPENDPRTPYNPKTGQIFTDAEMRRAIEAIISKYRSSM